MTNKVFGDVTFDDGAGWVVNEPLKMELWGSSYSVKVTAESYSEDEAITKEQENAYKKFKSVLSKKQTATEKLLSDYLDDAGAEQLRSRLTPKFLIINDEGECALLFDDTEDEDDGLAVVLLPEEEVMTQDEYL